MLFPLLFLDYMSSCFHFILVSRLLDENRHVDKLSNIKCLIMFLRWFNTNSTKSPNGNWNACDCWWTPAQSNVWAQCYTASRWQREMLCHTRHLQTTLRIINMNISLNPLGVPFNDRKSIAWPSVSAAFDNNNLAYASLLRCKNLGEKNEINQEGNNYSLLWTQFVTIHLERVVAGIELYLLWSDLNQRISRPAWWGLWTVGGSLTNLSHNWYLFYSQMNKTKQIFTVGYCSLGKHVSH